jgi:hypothetical protein
MGKEAITQIMMMKTLAMKIFNATKSIINSALHTNFQHVQELEMLLILLTVSHFRFQS